MTESKTSDQELADAEYIKVLTKYRGEILGEYLISGRRDRYVTPLEKGHNAAIQDIVDAIDVLKKKHENRLLK